MPDHSLSPSHDPEGQGDLRHLAPDVDIDVGAATQAFRALRSHRARRRRALQGFGAVAILAGGGLGLAARRDSDAPATVVAASPSADSLSAAGYGFELTVETPSEALVGTTIEVTYHLRNTTDHPSYFDGGASFKLVDRSDPDAQEVATFRRGWDGDLATLPDWIRTAHAPGGVAVPLAPVPVLGQPVGLQPVVCDLMKRPWPALDAGDPIEADPCAQHTAMPAGSTFDQTVTFDLQWGLGALPDLDLRVATGKLGPAGQEPPDTDRLSVTAPLDFQDDPRRLASVEPALAPDAIPAAPTLAEWLTTTRQLPKSSDFFTELIWRNGNWELWVLPRVPNNPVLPIRVLWDADRNQVVDVRTTNFYPVMGNVGGPAAPPEEVRYHVD